MICDLHQKFECAVYNTPAFECVNIAETPESGVEIRQSCAETMLRRVDVVLCDVFAIVTGAEAIVSDVEWVVVDDP